MFDCISYTIPQNDEPTEAELLEQQEAEAMPPLWVELWLDEKAEADGAPDRAEQ